MIRVEDLHMHFGGIRAVDGVTVSIAKGSITGLIGPNGAGKSTLLRVATGLLAPSVGRVTLDGAPVRGLDRAAVARRIAVVPQVAALPFSARVEEVVALGRVPHEDPIRGSRPADRAAVAAAVERVGLGHRLNHFPRQLG